ncbi:MAG: D-aminoacyl-tRNA deacylase [Acidimicrobiia bacterium]|nr:D-aminoacyl-tRNA deacylase [Acidimicrobiia bacterium]
MRALVQRVTEASVVVDGEVVSAIGAGLCVLVGVTHHDDAAVAKKLASKVWNLRILGDAGSDGGEPGGMNRSAADVDAPLLVVSQFTLYGDTRRGRRPSWSAAAAPEVAEPLCRAFAGALRGLGATVATGVFGADMEVSLVNDGPVTLLLEIPTSRP